MVSNCAEAIKTADNCKPCKAIPLSFGDRKRLLHAVEMRNPGRYRYSRYFAIRLPLTIGLRAVWFPIPSSFKRAALYHENLTSQRTFTTSNDSVFHALDMHDSFHFNTRKRAFRSPYTGLPLNFCEPNHLLWHY
jgi:hypothetical protein